MHRGTSIAWARPRGVVRFGFTAAEAFQTDLLERRIAPDGVVVEGAGSVRINVRPFQLITLRARR